MKTMVFAGRNFREIMRDPLNIFFGLCFPLAILLLLSAIQANIPVSLFEINYLAPGIAVFGLSFVALFSGTLVAKDRETSFLLRLFASPMKGSNFILGYALPLLPLAAGQTVVCFGVSALLGMELSWNTLLTVAVLMPAAVFFIGIGLLVGSTFNAKQVGGLCGALLVNVSAWLSGTWFDLSLVGGVFKKVAYCLPFAHAVDAARAAASGAYGDILPHLAWVLGYAVVAVGAAILVFRRRMKSDKK